MHAFLQVAMLDALKACVGWQCEGSGQQLTLRCGPLFCVKLQVPSQADSHIQGSIQLTPTGMLLPGFYACRAARVGCSQLWCDQAAIFRAAIVSKPARILYPKLFVRL